MTGNYSDYNKAVSEFNNRAQLDRLHRMLVAKKAARAENDDKIIKPKAGMQILRDRLHINPERKVRRPRNPNRQNLIQELQQYPGVKYDRRESGLRPLGSLRRPSKPLPAIEDTRINNPLRPLGPLRRPLKPLANVKDARRGENRRRLAGPLSRPFKPLYDVNGAASRANRARSVVF